MLNFAFKFKSRILKFLGRFGKVDNSISAIEFNSPEQAEEQWSKIGNVKKFFSSSVESFNQEIIRILEQKNIDLRNKKIADIGCGTGQLLKLIAINYNPSHCVGMDFSMSAIKIAQKIYPEAIYKQHNIYNPIHDKFYLITCTEVLEHLLDPEIALRNLLDALEESGWLFITVPDGRKDYFEGHINFWSPESWEHFIMKNSDNCRFECGKIGRQNLYALLQKSEPLPEQPV